MSNARVRDVQGGRGRPGHPQLFVTGALVALALAVTVATPGPARACSCASRSASLAWPKADAAAPIDGPIIVYASPAQELRLAVRDPSGGEVPIQVVRTLEASPGCGQGMQDVVVFQPSAPLRPGTTYTVEFTFPPPEGGTLPPIPAAAFTTGSGPGPAVTAPQIRRWLYAQIVSDDSRVLQVFAQAAGEHPVFMVARGNPATLVLGLGPLASAEPVGVSMGKVACADLEFVAHTGQTITTERLCEPEKCDRPRIFRRDTCGSNDGGDAWQSWQQRSGPCSDSGGCSLGGSPAVTGPTGSGLLLAALLLAGRRRRRSATIR